MKAVVWACALFRLICSLSPLSRASALLPTSLSTLSLAENELTDLNEVSVAMDVVGVVTAARCSLLLLHLCPALQVSSLSRLGSLTQLSIMGNPCVAVGGSGM